MEINKEKALRYFEQYPNASSLYFTEDGYCFLEESDASNHAKAKKIAVERVNKTVLNRKKKKAALSNSSEVEGEGAEVKVDEELAVEDLASVAEEETIEKEDK